MKDASEGAGREMLIQPQMMGVILLLLFMQMQVGESQDVPAQQHVLRYWSESVDELVSCWQQVKHHRYTTQGNASHTAG